VKITNQGSKRSVFCEALQFERNFLAKYSGSPPRIAIDKPESAIVMSAWYRARLGDLETQHDYPLSVVSANSWYGKFRACADHPQTVVRVAVWLGVISVALGMSGVALGLISLCTK
jgi:hypothetical protein